MMFEVSKEFRFEAAHSLPHLPEGHKCKRLHGHSYKVVVICRGKLDDRGFVVDYAEISDAVRPITDGMLDHRNIDEVLVANRGGPSTAENLAAWLFPRIKKVLPSLHQIEVHETATTVVRYPIYGSEFAASRHDQAAFLKDMGERGELDMPMGARIKRGKIPGCSSFACKCKDGGMGRASVQVAGLDEEAVNYG